MASRKDPSGTLPLTVDNEESPSATITYANDVVAIIAGLAANEVEGIAGMCNVSGNLLSKNRNVTRGVKVEIGTEEVAVDLYVIVEYGTPIQRAAMDAQESVRKAIESMTGLHVVRVDVHVQSVSFEKENNALQAGAASAALESGDLGHDPEPEARPEENPPVQPKAEPEAAPAEAEKPEEAPVSEDAASGSEEKKPAGTPRKKPAKNRKADSAADTETDSEPEKT